MESKLYDPSIHQGNVEFEDYCFDHIFLRQCIDRFRQDHPEATVESLADHAGLALSTFKKLKDGKIADPRGSTYYLLDKAFGADPRRLMGIRSCAQIPVVPINNNVVESMQIRLDEKRQRIEELEYRHSKDLEEMDRLRKLVLKAETEKTKSAADTEARDRVIADRDASISRRDNMIRNRNRIIIALASVIFVILVADMLLGNVGWFRFGPL